MAANIAVPIRSCQRRRIARRKQVLDLPKQCSKAADNVKKAGLEGQVDTLPQDLLDPSFRIPSKYDAVMMVHTIREWSPTNVQESLAPSLPPRPSQTPMKALPPACRLARHGQSLTDQSLGPHTRSRSSTCGISIACMADMSVACMADKSVACMQRFLNLICDALKPGGFVFMDMVSSRITTITYCTF